MGFPMTVERVIARNRLTDVSLLDDIRRLAEDSVTLARADTARDPEGLRVRIATNVVVAIVGLPNSGGVTWSEAEEIGRRVAALATSPEGGSDD